MKRTQVGDSPHLVERGAAAPPPNYPTTIVGFLSESNGTPSNADPLIPAAAAQNQRRPPTMPVEPTEVWQFPPDG